MHPFARALKKRNTLFGSSKNGRCYPTLHAKLGALMLSSRAAPPPAPHFIARWIPAIHSLRGYNLRTFRSDFLAGMTVAAVAVPQAMAYALIAGLPVEIGLYTAIVMTFVGALFDSSKQLINGPTNAISIATLSIIAPVTTPENIVPTAIMLAMMVGTIQLGIFSLRLGDLSRYISHSVIIGFTTGASFLLVLDQLKNLTGVAVRGGVHDGFLVRFYHTWLPFPELHQLTMLVGLGTIVLTLALRWVKHRLGLSLLPELLIAVILSGCAVAQFDLDQQGVKVVGEIPARLPHFAVPVLNFDLAREMASGAIALALLGSLEAISMAKAIAATTRQRLDINQQILSEGVANLTGSFFQCFPGSGSLTRSAINQQAGAETQWSGVFSAIFVATTMLLFAPLARYIPRAALAGLLIIAAFKMVEWKGLAFHLRVSRFDATIVLATALSAVAISIEFCVLIGVLTSFLMAVPRVGSVLLTEFVANESGYVHERLYDDARNERLLVFGIEGELFFAASASLEQKLDRIAQAVTPQTRVIVLRLKRARNPDAVGLQLLEEFLVEMKHHNITVLLCGVRTAMYEVLKKAGMAQRLGDECVFVEQPIRQTSTHQALLYAEELLARA